MLREYKEYIQKILDKLWENKLQVNIEKCQFYIKEVLYLGIIIGKHGIKIDPEKIVAIREWAYPENIRDMQFFLGFTNFYY